MSDLKTTNGRKARVGLAVAFAALGDTERNAIEVAWRCSVAVATEWEPSFVAFGLEPVTSQARAADILVYLGESSRFAAVAAEAAAQLPVVFIKSTVEELLEHAPDAPPRYRMCTGVKGIARALAQVAPGSTVADWEALPWPESVASLTHLGAAERSYVDASVAAFREAAVERKLRWEADLPVEQTPGQPFAVFLTMHDPAASILAATALRLWPQCTVLAADGMVATRSPSGEPWPERLLRVRHWSSRSRSESNRLFRQAMHHKGVPDFDSAGMLFGTMRFLEGAFAAGARPADLHLAGRHPGPLGPMSMTSSGRPHPERLVVFQGERIQVVRIASL